MEVAGACERLGGDPSALVFTPAMTDQYLQEAGLDRVAVKPTNVSEDLKPPPGSDCATWTTLAVDEHQNHAVKNRRQKDCNTISNLVRISSQAHAWRVWVTSMFFFFNRSECQRVLDDIEQVCKHDVFLLSLVFNGNETYSLMQLLMLMAIILKDVYPEVWCTLLISQ